MNIINHSLNTLKYTAIGAAAGIGLYSAKVRFLERFCFSMPYDLRKYVCLNTSTYFDIKKYTHLIALTTKWHDAIKKPLLASLPFTPLANFCIADGFNEELIYRLFVQKIAFIGLDYLLSKIPISQTKKLPRGLESKRVQQENPPGAIQKIRTLLSHKATRIFLSTAIFTAAHLKNESQLLIPQALSGLVYGIVCEEAGFFAAMTAHAVHNFVSYKLMGM